MSEKSMAICLGVTKFVIDLEVKHLKEWFGVDSIIELGVIGYFSERVEEHMKLIERRFFE